MFGIRRKRKNVVSQPGDQPLQNPALKADPHLIILPEKAPICQIITVRITDQSSLVRIRRLKLEANSATLNKLIIEQIRKVDIGSQST